MDWLNKEEVMKKWDYIRELITEDRGSLPRDVFESIIDGYIEDINELKKENTKLVKTLENIMSASPDKWNMSVKEFNEQYRQWSQNIASSIIELIKDR